MSGYRELLFTKICPRYILYGFLELLGTLTIYTDSFVSSSSIQKPGMLISPEIFAE
jgi:hypothetical protein